MTLTINGQKKELSPDLTVTELLAQLGFGDKPVVIELNQRALSPSEFAEQKLKDQDQVEIITIAAGG